MTLRLLQPCLDPASDRPLALQVAHLLVREIREGRLRPGEVLPGSRVVSEELGITRHAAMSALRELELEGWVETRPGSGTYVAERLPVGVPRHWGEVATAPTLAEAPAFELPESLTPVTSLALNVLDLSEGLPDARLAPKEALARAYQRALRRHGDDLLAKGEPRGNQALREQLAEHLRSHRGLPAGPEHLLITRGPAMARTLLAAALLPKGGHVAMEDPGQPEAWETFRAVAGAVLHPVPVDADGLDTEALAILAARQPLDAVLVTPRRQQPTTVPLVPERRGHLLALARQHGFAVIEEDPDAEWFGETEPTLPLAATDGEGLVVHVGSFAHTLAPGLGLGFLVGPRVLVDRLSRTRQRLDLQGDRVLEWAVADLIRDGDYARHLARQRAVYSLRRDDFLEALAVDLGAGFSARRPGGGLACWVETPLDLDLEALAARARETGLRLRPGARHAFDGRRIPAFPFGFGALEAAEQRRALRTLRGLLEALHG